MARKEEKVFPLAVNEARGEVPLWVGDVPIVLAAEMGRLAAVSARLQCRSLSELYTKLSGVEVGAVFAGVELLAVRGKVIEALEVLSLKHFGACRIAFIAALAYHMDEDEVEDEGNEAAVEKAA